MQTLNTHELRLDEFNVDDVDWPESALRSSAGPAAYFTELESLRGTSVLVVAPPGTVWCSVPESSFSRGRGHHPVEGQGPWQDFLDRAFLRPGVEREFSAELKRHRIKTSALRYGLLPYVGATSRVDDDMGFGTRLQPLWQQWFRVYLIPSGARSRQLFVQAFSALLAERSGFALRNLPDVRIEEGVQYHFDDNDVRDEALLWSYHSNSASHMERPAFATQMRALQHLAQAVRAAEEGRLPVWSSLSPAFNDWSARVVLADQRPQSLRELNAERISSYRVRLMRLTGWPVFCDVLKQVPGRVKRRLADFDPPPEPLPYDIAAQAQALVDDVCARYPSYTAEPFDAVVAA